MRAAGRLPPGQSLTLKWPVLQVGSVPPFDPHRWDFRDFRTGGAAGEAVVGGVWPAAANRGDGRHALRDALEPVRQPLGRRRGGGSDEAREVEGRGAARDGACRERLRRANLPLEDLLRPTSLFALEHDGELLTGEHGYPLRLVAPQLYAWKSVKWVRGIELLDRVEPGFWEQNGYHIYGDPFRGERYSG